MLPRPAVAPVPFWATPLRTSGRLHWFPDAGRLSACGAQFAVDRSRATDPRRFGLGSLCARCFDKVSRYHATTESRLLASDSAG